MHLVACKGVLSATPNAKDMTSDAWDCLKTRILGPLWLGSYDLMKGMKGFLAKRARLRVVEEVTKKCWKRDILTSIDLSTRRYHEKIPSKVFRFSYIITFFPIVLADLLTSLGPRKKSKMTQKPQWICSNCSWKFPKNNINIRSRISRISLPSSVKFHN